MITFSKVVLVNCAFFPLKGPILFIFKSHLFTINQIIFFFQLKFQAILS